jgi:tRNA/rRNA methyltransferase
MHDSTARVPPARSTGLGLRLRVVLVEPEKAGNIGSIARSMKNFDLTDLRIVSPKAPITEEAYRYATRGREILEKAKIFKTLPEALKGARHVVGTTAIAGTSTRNLLRITMDPSQLALRLAETKGSVALLLGRESSGLTNAELEQCNVIVTIPASKDYNVLNVATAASILFYELFKIGSKNVSSLEPSRQAVERLASIFVDLAETVDTPPHRRRLADRAFRNILAKSVVSRREVSLIMGVLRRLRERTQSPVGDAREKKVTSRAREAETP